MRYRITIPACVTIAALSLFVSSPVDALQNVPIRPGERVRVISFQGQLRDRVGVFHSLADDVFRFVPEGSDDVRSIDTGALRRVARFAGRKRNGWAGAAVGGVPFAVAAALLYASDPGDEALEAGNAVAVGLMAGAIGAMGGGLIGAHIKTDRWEDIPLEQLSVGLAPDHGAIGIGVRFRF